MRDNYIYPNTLFYDILERWSHFKDTSFPSPSLVTTQLPNTLELTSFNISRAPIYGDMQPTYVSASNIFQIIYRIPV